MEQGSCHHQQVTKGRSTFPEAEAVTRRASYKMVAGGGKKRRERERSVGDKGVFGEDAERWLVSICSALETLFLQCISSANHIVCLDLVHHSVTFTWVLISTV